MAGTSLPRKLGEEKGGVFYLHGGDELGKEAAARALMASHLDPGTRDFNFDLLRGSDLSVETLASVLGTPPMMAEWRVVLLREVQALAASARARSVLLEAAAAPPPGLALILLGTEPAGSSARFYSDLKKAARSAEFRPPSANDLPAWLMNWSLEVHGREMEEDAARALAQAVGGEPAILAQEVEKLATLVGEGGKITLAVVEAAGTSLPRQDRWQWFDLIGEGRFREALTGLPILLDQGESGVALTAGIGTHLLRIGVAVEGGARAVAAVLEGKQGFLVQRIERQARGWSSARIRAALDRLLEVDRLLKSSGISELILLEGWILERVVEAEGR